jgi:hypothetical protein
MMINLGLTLGLVNDNNNMYILQFEIKSIHKLYII